ncbi:MAG: FtsX-like permease family protein [Methanobacterium sp.]|nr:FtsX-like permease family protein [Methanobacterium sp.]
MGIYSLSFKNLRRRKLRSILTMLGVVIGVTALVVLVGLTTGMTSYMKESTGNMMGDILIMNSTGGGALMSSPGSSFLDPEAVDEIKNMSQLYNIKEDVEFLTEFNGTQIYIVGTSDWSQIKINGTSGVVVSKTLEDMGYKVGSKITIKDQEMTVTGTFTEGSMGMGVVIMDSSRALPLNNNKSSSITANTRGDPEVVKNEVEKTVNGTTASTKSDLSKQIDDLMNGLTLFIGGIASIALLVGVISIVNIMLVNVTERTREIGVLKAIGFTNREVLGSILLESALIGFIGGIVGLIIAAILLQTAIILFGSQIGDIKLISMLPLWLIVGVIGGATGLSVLAGLYPAWRASRLNVVEALRNE